MKRNKKPQGSMVLFFETDLKKAKPIEAEKMSQAQRQCFSKMSETEQEKIKAGYGTVVKDLESDKTICEFNMENYQPPDWAIESFARAILPMIQEFYSHEENRRKYDEWDKARNEDK